MSDERVKVLEEHSAMLGQIAGVVESWCVSEECTTLDAVRLLHAECLTLRAKLVQQEIYRKYHYEAV